MDSTKAYNVLYFHFYKGLLGYKELAEKDLWLKGGVRNNEIKINVRLPI